MPEGNTIHRVVVDQAPRLVGRALAASSPNRRFESGAAAIDGRVLESLEAWGKHLFYSFPGRRVLHVHLGMDGRIRPTPVPPRPPPMSVWLRVTGPDGGFDLSTPSVCQVIDAVHRNAIAGRLGPDPIRTADDGGRVLPRLRDNHGPIGVALVDQSLVAGIGNIYRAEILFACGIHPERPASTIDPGEWDALWKTSVALLRAGVRDGGQIRTVDRRDLKVRDGRQVYVYGQRSCARCGSRIRRWQLGGRVAYACETCQPLDSSIRSKRVPGADNGRRWDR